MIDSKALLSEFIFVVSRRKAYNSNSLPPIFGNSYIDMTDESDSQSSSTKRSGRNDSNRKAKLFRCTGYGNCDMVFTRSEHLARHAR